MDLLRDLALLPVRLARFIYASLASILPPLVGRVSWSAPPWVHASAASLRARPREYAGGACCGRRRHSARLGGLAVVPASPAPARAARRIVFDVHAPAITLYEYDDARPASSSIRWR